MKIQLREFDVLKSTNETAVAMAQEGAPEGTVIVAARQESGHGRMQRVWSSPLGGLWFTVILRPQIDPQYAAQITLLAGVAVAKAVRRLYDTESVQIKWPNDLLLDGKKICGILSELQLDENGVIDYAIVGIGVNVALSAADFPAEVAATATSLNTSLHKDFTCDQVLVAIMEEFGILYDKWLLLGADVVMKEWQKLNCTVGRHVLVKDNDQVVFAGTVIDVDEEGAIIVRNEQGIVQSFNFGEISIR